MEDKKSMVSEKLARNPGILFEKLAESNDMTHAQVVECLPQAMWRKVNGEHFIALLQEIRTWGKLTTILHTPDVIMEFVGSFPSGEEGHGFYNLAGEGDGLGLHGHLRHQNCASIYFVDRPFKGVDTRSLLFVNKAGGFMFKIFLARDKSGSIEAEQSRKFDALMERLSS